MGYTKDGARVGLITVIILVFFALIGISVWTFNVLTASVRGQGDAVIQEQSAENWTAAQARFEELYADITATDRKITVAAEQRAANPDDKTAADTYLGTVNYCLTIVGEYNAEARKFLSEDFRSVDLPPQIDNFNPSTDCKE